MTDSTPPEKTIQATSASYLILPAWILALTAMCALMEQAASLFLWIACSFCLLTLLDPGFQLLRKRVPKSLAAMALVLAALMIALVFVYLMVHFSAQMIADLESSKKLFIQYYRSLRQTWEGWMQVFSPPGHQTAVHAPAPAATPPTLASSPQPEASAIVPPVVPVAAAPVTANGGAPFGTEFASTVARGVGSFVGILVYAFLCPVLTFFMMTERDHVGRVFQKAMRRPERGPEMWQRIVVAIRAYFVGNLVLGIVSFPILVGLFFAFKVPSPITLAALASVFNLIPFLGAVLSGLLPAVSLLSSGAHLGTVIALYGLCAAFHMILANFVTPKVLGQRLNVNATTSTLALVIFGELLGGVGLLLAIPLVATVKIIFETSDMWWLRWIASIMDEKPRP